MRDGTDLLHELHVSFTQAALGATLDSAFFSARVALPHMPPGGAVVAVSGVVVLGGRAVVLVATRVLLGRGAVIVLSTTCVLGGRAVVVRRAKGDDLKKRASLLRRDSIHGAFAGSITVDEEKNQIIANGNVIQVIYSNDPSEVDYTDYGINDAILIDNTGIWRDREGLSAHLRPGIAKVLLTAPGKGDVPNIVHGVNHLEVDPDEKVLSCASCTTNAIVPPLKAMEDRFGIVRGHVETVHSFTNDQNLLDNYHKADRRGRSAPLNLVLTETGAASAVAKAMPDFKAKITGNSIRVPTPDVSIAILSLQLKQETTREEVLDHLGLVSLTGPLSRQLDYTAASDAVSSDFIGSRAACIIDANAAIVDGDSAILYVWYDNEFGYSCQVVRTLQHISGVEYPTLPAV